MLKFCTAHFTSKFNILFFAIIVFTSLTIHADGLPGEHYVTQRWRDVFYKNSPSFNPAYMTEENYLSVRGAICPTLRNTFFLFEGGVTYPIGLFQSVGFTWLGLAANDPIKAALNIDNNGKIVESDEIYKDFHSLYIFSYAYNFWDRLSAGINVNGFHYSNFGDPKGSIALDLGLSYRVLRDPFLGDHVVGLNFQNVQSLFTDDTYAANLKMSWFAKFWESRIEAGLDLDIKDFGKQAAEAKTKEIEFDYNFRVGGWILRMISVYFQQGSQYWGLTAGMNVPTINMGRDFQINYQFTSIVDDNPLTSTHTVYIRADLGLHREEIWARKKAIEVAVGANGLYNQARTFFAQEKYYDALFVLGRIQTEFPEFALNDKVTQLYAESFEKMDMRDLALKHYKNMKKNYPNSEVVPNADLGIMRIHYRNGNHAGVVNQFANLNKSSVSDKIKYEAYYYMGQSFIREREFKEAVQLLSQIPDTHYEYPFAQYSLGTSYASLKQLEKALESLDNAAQFQASSREQEEIINKSLVLLGLAYFEGLGGKDKALSKAITALRKVQKNSNYYEDALLGQAWTSLSANEYNDCIAAAKELAAVSKKTILQCEAALLQGNCLMFQKKYDEALAVMLPAKEKLAASKGPSKEEKSEKALQYDADKSSYYGTSSSMEELSLTSHSSYVLSQIDSLRAPQMEGKKKIVAYQKYVDEYQRRAFFSRSRTKVLEDLDFAIAQCEKIATTSTSTQGSKKGEQTREEIEELERKLKELEQSEQSEENEE